MGKFKEDLIIGEMFQPDLNVVGSDHGNAVLYTRNKAGHVIAWALRKDWLFYTKYKVTSYGLPLSLTNYLQIPKFKPPTELRWVYTLEAPGIDISFDANVEMHFDKHTRMRLHTVVLPEKWEGVEIGKRTFADALEDYASRQDLAYPRPTNRR